MEWVYNFFLAVGFIMAGVIFITVAEYVLGLFFRIKQ